MKLLFIDFENISPVIPGSTRNPQPKATNKPLKPWILNRVQDDRPIRGCRENGSAGFFVIPGSTRNPQPKATNKPLKPWILDARRKYPWVRVQDDNRGA